MWDCVTKKHEAYKVAMLKALTYLSSKVSTEHIHYLFAKVKSLQMNEIDKFYIGFIRQLARRLSSNEALNDGQIPTTHQTRS